MRTSVPGGSSTRPRPLMLTPPTCVPCLLSMSSIQNRPFPSLPTRACRRETRVSIARFRSMPAALLLLRPTTSSGAFFWKTACLPASRYSMRMGISLRSGFVGNRDDFRTPGVAGLLLDLVEDEGQCPRRLGGRRCEQLARLDPYPPFLGGEGVRRPRPDDRRSIRPRRRLHAHRQAMTLPGEDVVVALLGVREDDLQVTRRAEVQHRQVAVGVRANLQADQIADSGRGDGDGFPGTLPLVNRALLPGRWPERGGGVGRGLHGDIEADVRTLPARQGLELVGERLQVGAADTMHKLVQRWPYVRVRLQSRQDRVAQAARQGIQGGNEALWPCRGVGDALAQARRGERGGARHESVERRRQREHVALRRDRIEDFRGDVAGRAAIRTIGSTREAEVSQQRLVAGLVPEN